MKYDKLVKDLIPKNYEKEGKTCVVEQLEMEDYASELIKVLDEEMANFKKSFNAEDDELAVKNIADVVEVLYAVLDLIGVEHSSFEKIRLANKQKFGGYGERLYLKEVLDND